jgi:hypothetical protein
LKNHSFSKIFDFFSWKIDFLKEIRKFEKKIGIRPLDYMLTLSDWETTFDALNDSGSVGIFERNCSFGVGGGGGGSGSLGKSA